MIDQRFEIFKNQSRTLSGAFKEISIITPSDILAKYFINRAQRVENCGNYLEFAGDDLVFANFCRDRLCPMCSWRKSKKMFSHLSRMLDRLPADTNLLLVTLTVKNCRPEELDRTFNLIFDRWELFTLGSDRRSPLPFLGLYRTLEITYNEKNNTFHPHIHCLCVVSKDYYKDLSQEDLCLRWKSALGLDYLPICDIRMIKNDPERSFLPEVAKYVSKAQDWLKAADAEIIMYLALALRNRRLFSFSGILGKINRELNGIDLETCDLNDRLPVRNDIISAFTFRNGFYLPCAPLQRSDPEEIKVI